MKFAAVLAAGAALACSAGSPALAEAQPQAPLKYGAWGFDAAGQDRSVNPGDDFFRYANGAWLNRTAIPGDKPGISLRLLMTDRAEARLHDIMEAAAATTPHEPTTVEGKVGAFYKAFMDEPHVEALGARPIGPELDAIRAATSRSQLAGLMGRANSDFYGDLFAVYLDADAKEPGRYAVYLNQDGLGLPDRDYYLQPQFAAQKARYQAHVETLLRLVSWPDPAAAAARVVALEAQVAAASWTKAQQRDPDAVYNPMTVAQLQALAPGFDWPAYLAAAELGGVGRVVVGEKSAFPKLAVLFASTPVETLQAWMAATVADNASPYLSRAFADEYFDFRLKTLTGQAEQQVRWKRGVHAVSGGDYGSGERFDRFGNLGWAAGQLYTARWFPPESKAKVQALVSNLKAAYRVRLQHLDWMGSATRAEAIRKLDTYVVKVGYPDTPRDYTGVAIADDDIVGDVRRAAEADWRFHVARLSGPVDKGEWSMTPQTNDAYNGSLRDIVFPAGILQPPVFDADADPAINYGAVGGIIGHEITHGFDDQGRKIDAEGRLRDWWTPADARAFEARSARLGAQYSAFEPLPGARVNGALTMGENIADLGGLTVALDAYHASLGGKPEPVIDGLTGDQRVFLGWAQAWRGKVRDDYVRKQVVSDPHAPRQYRVNGVVRNIDAWYGDFAIKPGEKLYVSPADRVRIW